MVIVIVCTIIVFIAFFVIGANSAHLSGPPISDPSPIDSHDQFNQREEDSQ